MQDIMARIARERPELAQIISDYSNMTDLERMQHRCRSANEDEGSLNKEDGYDCRICKNKGYIMVVREDETPSGVVYSEASRPCKCAAIRDSIKRMKRSGLESIIRDCTLEKYETDTPWRQTIKKKAVQFLQDDTAKVFFIGGQSGAGKTHICTGICSKLIKRGHEVKYMLWMNESKELKSEMNESEYADHMRKLEQVDVLYIDDFLKMPNGEPPSKGDLNIAIELINNRYLARGNKTTILSSEWTVDDILDFDEALGGRIVELCGEEYEINIAKDRSKNYRLRGRATL